VTAGPDDLIGVSRHSRRVAGGLRVREPGGWVLAAGGAGVLLEA
jgi:hypothetical protein